jgi:ribonuclease HI
MAKIYTDGSCLKNPGGPGGWAFALIENNEIWYVSGGEKSTTNNRMEMKAVIEALKFSQNTNYIIYTDSQLILNCAQKIWKRKSNNDLWEQYESVSIGKNLKWEWIRSHNGDKYNEIVDKMAKKEAILLNN